MTWTASQSTALYVRALTALGANLIYRVPHRKKDGYDLRTVGVQWAHEQGASFSRHVRLWHSVP